jgi:hypothetical protein
MNSLFIPNQLIREFYRESCERNFDPYLNKNIQLSKVTLIVGKVVKTNIK